MFPEAAPYRWRERALVGTVRARDAARARVQQMSRPLFVGAVVVLGAAVVVIAHAVGTDLSGGFGNQVGLLQVITDEGLRREHGSGDA